MIAKTLSIIVKIIIQSGEVSSLILEGNSFNGMNIRFSCIFMENISLFWNRLYDF